MSNKSKGGKVLDFSISAFLYLVIWASFFMGARYISDMIFWGRIEANQDLVILKKTENKVIIPYIYNFSDSKRFYDYKKVGNKTEVVELASKQIQKEYDGNMKKQDTLYDTFLVKNTMKRYDVNLKELGKYDFRTMLESFSTAPYYDTLKKSLYIFSHSSGKNFNPWKDYYSIKNWDSLEFLDYDTQAVDTYSVESVNIVSKDEFNDSVFLSIQDRIVLVTCYPLNSTAKRLYVVLKKQK